MKKGVRVKSARSAGSVKEASLDDEFVDRVLEHRLHEEAVDARLVRHIPELLLTVRSQAADKRLLVEAVALDQLSDLPGGLGTVELRHAKVH